MDIHNKIYRVAQKLGYLLDDEGQKVRGLCHGIAIRWLEASFLKEEDKFYDRLKKLETLTQEDFIRLKKREWRKLSLEDYELLGFLESMLLFQYPCVYDDIIAHYHMVSQNDIEFVSRFASSIESLKLKGLAEISREVFFHDDAELESYLNDLASLINLYCEENAPFGLILHSDCHTVALNYRKESGWSFFDINDYSTIEEQKAQPELKTMVKTILQDRPLAFASKLITVGANKVSLDLKKALVGLNEKYKINLEKVSLDKGGVLPRIAAMMNKKNLISSLAKAGIDLNKKDDEGYAPVHLAAKEGAVGVIEKLAKHGVDLNTKENSGFAAIHMAVIANHLDIIDALARGGANMNLFTDNRDTALHLAASEDNIAAFETLCENGACLGLKNYAGETVAQIAAIRGCLPIINIIGEQQKSYLREVLNGPSPALLAVIYNQFHIVDALLDLDIDCSKKESLSLDWIPYLLEYGLREEQVAAYVQSLDVNPIISISPLDIIRLKRYEKGKEAESPRVVGTSANFFKPAAATISETQISPRIDERKSIHARRYSI